jgi:hypothetical protein
MNERFVHDVALMMAEHSVEMPSILPLEMEHQTARKELYPVCKAGIGCYPTM